MELFGGVRVQRRSKAIHNGTLSCDSKKDKIRIAAGKYDPALQKPNPKYVKVDRMFIKRGLVKHSYAERKNIGMIKLNESLEIQTDIKHLEIPERDLYEGFVNEKCVLA